MASDRISAFSSAIAAVSVAALWLPTLWWLFPSSSDTGSTSIASQFTPPAAGAHGQWQQAAAAAPLRPLDLRPEELADYRAGSGRMHAEGNSQGQNTTAYIGSLLAQTLLAYLAAAAAASAAQQGVSKPEQGGARQALPGDAPEPAMSDTGEGPEGHEVGVAGRSPSQDPARSTSRSRSRSPKQARRSRGESIGASFDALVTSATNRGESSVSPKSAASGSTRSRSRARSASIGGAGLRQLQADLPRVDLSAADRRLNGLGYEMCPDGILRFWVPSAAADGRPGTS